MNNLRTRDRTLNADLRPLIFGREDEDVSDTALLPRFWVVWA